MLIYHITMQTYSFNAYGHENVLGTHKNTIEITKEDLNCNITEILAVKSSVFPSKGECRKMVTAGGVSINKTKVESPEELISSEDLLNNKYILIQKGKKNYYILKLK